MNVQKVLNIILALCVLLLIIYFRPSSNTNIGMSKDSVLEVIHQRKSVRNFTDKKVNKEDLETIVKAGMAAPTAVNKQPWAFIAISNRSVLDSLERGLPYAKMLKTASAAIVVCGDLTKTLDGMGQEFWIQDCSAASQNILLATESMGLGAVWTAVYPDKDRIEFVRNTLSLPEHIVPLNVIPIGYPTGTDKPKDKWKPENLHWQKW